LVEVLIALFLVSIGVLALLSLQPSAWRASSRSDFLGRAVGILHQELEARRIFILNENNGNPCTAANPLIMPPRPVYPSDPTGQRQISGDVPFTVQTTITDLARLAPPQPNSWRITVHVTWPGNPTGITETIIVGRQLSFLWPSL